MTLHVLQLKVSLLLNLCFNFVPVLHSLFHRDSVMTHSVAFPLHLASSWQQLDLQQMHGSKVIQCQSLMPSFLWIFNSFDCHKWVCHECFDLQCWQCSSQNNFHLSMPWQPCLIILCFDSWIAGWLSIQIWVGSDDCSPISFSTLRNQMISAPPSFRAMYSASQLDLATFVCILLFHDIAHPLNKHMYPVRDLLRSSVFLSLIHIWRCRRLLTCRSRWSPDH